MPLWIRFSHEGQVGFGTLERDVITVHTGNMFEDPTLTERRIPFSAVSLLSPTRPSKMIALWNNFHALGAKLGVSTPEDPLYFLKAPSSFADPGATIRRPASYSGRVVFEGELGIVIGSTCREASASEAARCIFGYTCINDLTASDVLSKDPNFPQWARAKSFDGFGPFGPVIATDVRPEELRVRTILNGEERQNYPIADMVFPAEDLVGRISYDMTLHPGDIICCGTSIGVGAMRKPSNEVEVVIDGIGSLRNTFVID